MRDLLLVTAPIAAVIYFLRHPEQLKPFMDWAASLLQ